MRVTTTLVSSRGSPSRWSTKSKERFWNVNRWCSEDLNLYYRSFFVQYGRDIPSHRPRGISGRHVSVTLTTGSASVTSRTARKPMTDREWWFVVVITGALTSSAVDKESSDRRLRQVLITFNWRHWVESKKTNIKKTSTKILRKNKDFEKESIQTRVQYFGV